MVSRFFVVVERGFGPYVSGDRCALSASEYAFASARGFVRLLFEERDGKVLDPVASTVPAEDGAVAPEVTREKAPRRTRAKTGE